MTLVSEILADSPLGYWKLDESAGATQFSDSSGNARPHTISGTPTLGAAGVDATSVSFSGTQYGSIVAPAWFSSLNSFTAEAWFKTTASTHGQLIGRDNSGTSPGTASRIFRLYLASAGNVSFFITNSVGSYHDFSSPATYNDGIWHHAAATWDGTTAVIYVDGVQVASRSLSGTTATGGTAPLLVGAGQNNTAGNYGQYNGAIDEVALYSTALSSTRISAHFSAAPLPDTIRYTSRLSSAALVADDSANRIMSRQSVTTLVSDAQAQRQLSRLSLQVLLPTEPRYRGWGVKG